MEEKGLGMGDGNPMIGGEEVLAATASAVLTKIG